MPPYSSIKDSLTEQQFRNRIAAVLSKIHCGHTVARASKEMTEYFARKRPPQFPFTLKLWKDSAVISTNYVKSDTVLKRGTVVQSINGIAIATIRDSIFKLIGTDGYAVVFKYQAVSLSFPAYYRNAYGVDSQYLIKYVDSMGIAKEIAVKNYVALNDSFAKKALLKLPGKRHLKQLKFEEKRSLLMDTTNSTAFMSVNTFSDGKLDRFFRKSFKKIDQQKIQNIAIDIRQNTGGDVEASTTLLQYLTDKPFRVADSVMATSRSFIYKKSVKSWFLYWLSMQFVSKKMSNGKYHFRYFEKHFFKPKPRHHFNGNIYVVSGGYTFSAASLFAGKLKGQQNVTIVGEETGGGYYGNSALFLPIIKLPNSGIRVTLPLFKMVWDSTRPKNGRGVFPDVFVQPTSIQIKQGIDAKMERVKQLIKEKMDH